MPRNPNAGVVTKAFLIDGSRYRRDGAQPREVVESFFVEGINPDNQPGQSQHLATMADGVPPLWSKHPLSEQKIVEDDLRAVSYRPRFVGTDKCILEVVYCNIGPFMDMRGGCALQIHDADTAYAPGAMFTTIANLPNRYPIILTKGAANAGFPNRPGIITTESQIMSITFSYTALSEFYSGPIDDATGRINPIAKASNYVGCINSAPFGFVDLMRPAAATGTLKVQNVSFNNDGLGNLAWNVSYEILYNPLTWHQEAVYMDSAGLPDPTLPDSDRITSVTPHDPRESTRRGRKLLQTALMIDFTNLLA